MNRIHRYLLAAAVALACCIGSAAAQAPAQPTAPAAAQPSTFSDDEIEAFARAYVKVAEVQRAHEDRIAAADDAEQRHRLEVRAQQEMAEAMQHESLDAQRFSEIAAAMLADARVQDRVLAQLADID